MRRSFALALLSLVAVPTILALQLHDGSLPSHAARSLTTPYDDIVVRGIADAVVAELSRRGLDVNNFLERRDENEDVKKKEKKKKKKKKKGKTDGSDGKNKKKKKKKKKEGSDGDNGDAGGGDAGGGDADAGAGGSSGGSGGGSGGGGSGLQQQW